MPAVEHNDTRNADPASLETPLSRPLSLCKNFSWTFAGNVVYAACQWAVLVILAKLGSPKKVGQLALGLAVTAPVIMFSNLQLRGVQATDAREEYRSGHYLAMRLVNAGIVAVSGFDWGMVQAR